MRPARLEHIEVGAGAERRRIAVLTRAGRPPGVFWLSGLRSEMTGIKAAALDAWAAANGHACTRLDYSGHGQSSGAFEQGTIARWLDEADSVFARTAGAQVVVGSSLGGWLALLLAKRVVARGEGARLAGMVLIAPAVDMTEALMWGRWSKRRRKALAEEGRVLLPSAYSAEPTVVTRALIEDGRNHLLGDRPVEVGCPVHVIQGMRDDDVPWRHATALMEKLAFDDAVLTLVRDGDHRLSRPEDIERMLRAVEQFAAPPGQLTLPLDAPS
jgi:alpha-beta hydrolase superfamily lysophospholipase